MEMFRKCKVYENMANQLNQQSFCFAESGNKKIPFHIFIQNVGRNSPLLRALNKAQYVLYVIHLIAKQGFKVL
jgi:hypothetical protein